MTAARTSTGTYRDKARRISLPDMAPFAGLVFLVVCFYMLAGNFKQSVLGMGTDTVNLENLPSTHQIHCWKGFTLDGSDGIVISLNRKNQFSFTLPAFSEKLRVLTIKQVAAKHNVSLTTAQLSGLDTMLLFTCNVESLPSLLNTPVWQQRQPIQTEKLAVLSSIQLAEYVAVSRKIARGHLKRPLNVYLKIEADVHASTFNNLILLLQKQGVNRYSLLTQGEL